MSDSFVPCAGLRASSDRLYSLSLFNVEIPKEALHELRLVYEHIAGKDIVLRELELYCNDFSGPVSGHNLRRLLLMLPGLKTLAVSRNFGGPNGATDLSVPFISPVIDQLHGLELRECDIGNQHLELLTLSLSDACSSLLQLDLFGNLIQGGTGGEGLANVLRRCENLQTLDLSGNDILGPDGARALAPALCNLKFLQTLDIGNCSIAECATPVLDSLLNASPCLNSLGLYGNSLPPSTLASLTNFLNGTGDCLEVLLLEENEDLFGTANLAQHGLFFDAIAIHSSLRDLNVRDCGLDNMKTTIVLFESAVFKNNSLVWVNMKPAEGIRSDILMALIQSTMISPTNVQLALWPKALGICTPPWRTSHFLFGSKNGRNGCL